MSAWRRLARTVLLVTAVLAVSCLGFFLVVYDDKQPVNTVERFIKEQRKLGKNPNRLIDEKSPYLLQHAFNPVDWYPWGEKAFEKARREGKPIFLSVGYSTCYWCHVMEREVFEVPEIARLMNEYFVNIKVDREERPDVDRVYMAAVQAITGSGGWPMSVFLTPDLKPFFGATYIPPVAQYGRLGFPELAQRIHELWKTQRGKIVESSDEITSFLRRRAGEQAPAQVGVDVLKIGYAQFLQQHDSTYGGFGGAPKFPRPVVFDFLLRYYERTGERTALEMSLKTLRAMALGGMYDHLGGGFHRYSVDAQWRVPHFEKMLYDQAQLGHSYVDAYQITHDEQFADVVRDVLGYVLRQMTHGEGGFYSAEDAESAIAEHEPEQKAEGHFYLWRNDEIEKILDGESARLFAYYYGVEKHGNTLSDPHGVFGDKNVLYIAHTIEETAGAFARSPEQVKSILADAQEKLFAVREKRPRPHLDDKILTSWNGLMISAFARAFQVLGDPRYLNAAEHACRFVLENMYNAERKVLYHRYRDGEAAFEGHLDDYAFLITGLLDLYEASFGIEWLQKAIELTEIQNTVFYDSNEGGFWDTSGKDKSILLRTREDYDGAEPTGNSIAVMNLLRLAQITSNKQWAEIAGRTIAFFGNRLKQIPHAMPRMLAAVDFGVTKPKQIILAGKPDRADTRALAHEVHSRYIPNKILVLADGDAAQRFLISYNDFFRSVTMRDGAATAYVCEDFVCKLPATSAEVLAEQLASSAQGSIVQ